MSVHFRDEAITATRERLDESWRVSRIIQCLAQPIDGVVQPVVEIYESFLGPKPFTHCFARYDFAWFFEQHGENLKWLVLQTDSSAVLEEFSGTEVNFEWAEPDKTN